MGKEAVTAHVALDAAAVVLDEGDEDVSDVGVEYREHVGLRVGRGTRLLGRALLPDHAPDRAPELAVEGGRARHLEALRLFPPHALRALLLGIHVCHHRLEALHHSILLVEFSKDRLQPLLEDV